MKKGILVLLFTIVLTLSGCNQSKIEDENYQEILTEKDLTDFKIDTVDLQMIQTKFKDVNHLFELIGDFPHLYDLANEFDDILAPNCRLVLSNYQMFYPLLNEDNTDLLVTKNDYDIFMYKEENIYTIQSSYSGSDAAITLTYDITTNRITLYDTTVNLSVFHLESGLDSIGRDVEYVLEDGLFFSRLRQQEASTVTNGPDLSNMMARTYAVITSDKAMFIEVQIYNDATNKLLPNALGVTYNILESNGDSIQVMYGFDTNLDADDFKEEITFEFLIESLNDLLDDNDQDQVPPTFEIIKRHF